MIFQESEENPGFKKQISTGGLPELTGAPLEIAGAAEIRAAVLTEADDILTLMRSNQVLTESEGDTAITAPEHTTEEQVRATETALNRLRNEADARWWIENGSRGVRELLAERAQQSP